MNLRFLNTIFIRIFQLGIYKHTTQIEKIKIPEKSKKNDANTEKKGGGWQAYITLGIL